MKYRIKTFLKYQGSGSGAGTKRSEAEISKKLSGISLECAESSSDHDRSDGRIFEYFQ